MKRRDIKGNFLEDVKIPGAKGAYFKYTSGVYSALGGREISAERKEITAVRELWDIPELGVMDDIAELKQTALNINRKSIRIIELLSNVPNIHKELSEIKTLIRAKLEETRTDFIGANEIIQEYIELIKVIDIVKQVYMFESGGCHNLWTVIDAPSFEDELRYPIYEAQMKIIAKNSRDNPVDFYILNINEMQEDKRIGDALPVNSILIWKHE